MTPLAYDVANSLYSAAPWGFLREHNLIALIDPTTGEKHHISLMGALGTHSALALYLGPIARQRFNTIQNVELPQDDHIALILGTPQLQCSFETRDQLKKAELDAIKASGKKYRGANWPTFRSFRPGLAPAPASPQDIDLLCLAIEQTHIVLKEINSPDDTQRFENSSSTILTRRFHNGEWRTEWTEDDTSLFAFPQPEPPEFLIKKILQYPKAKPLGVSFQILPIAMTGSSGAELFPYFLLVADLSSGFILGFEMLNVEQHQANDIPAVAVTSFLKIMDRHSICPTSLDLTSPVTATMLHQTMMALNGRCHVIENIPALEQAMESILGRLMR
jgi:hypothetical protein